METLNMFEKALMQRVRKFEGETTTFLTIKNPNLVGALISLKKKGLITENEDNKVYLVKI